MRGCQNRTTTQKWITCLLIIIISSVRRFPFYANLQVIVTFTLVCLKKGPVQQGHMSCKNARILSIQCVKLWSCSIYAFSHMSFTNQDSCIILSHKITLIKTIEYCVPCFEITTAMNNLWVGAQYFLQDCMCAQRRSRLRSASASAQADQTLRCPPEDTLDPSVSTVPYEVSDQTVWMRR